MNIENVIIIGSGPAAYSAAMQIKDLKPILFEGEIVGDIGPGGQLTTTTKVDNYPGFPHGTEGPELMDQMRDQAISMGIRIVSKNVESVSKIEKIFFVKDKENEYKSNSVIIATGASAKRLYAPGTGEDGFWQKGISACAVCDGFFFRNKVVAIIGGGDSAMEETLYMSNIASKVYLIHRRTGFRARADKLEQVKSRKNIEIITPSELVSAHGDSVLRFLRLVNPENNQEFDLKVDGLFFAIGHVPNVKFLGKMVEFENGYVKTDKFMKTSVEGMFACGDVQDYHYRQAVTAAASGCIAGKSCIEYLNSLN